MCKGKIVDDKCDVKWTRREAALQAALVREAVNVGV